MKLIFSCSSEDIEFIELVKNAFESKGTISEYKVSGITGYETVMLVLQMGAIMATTIVPFIVEYMTSNKESRIKSKRCIIDNKNKTINLEGYDEKVIQKIVEKVIEEQNQ